MAVISIFLSISLSNQSYDSFNQYIYFNWNYGVQHLQRVLSFDITNVIWLIVREELLI